MILISLAGCDNSTPNTTPSIFNGNLTGSYYEGNYVYGAAMNLAWNELNENILEENLVLDTDDEDALGYVEKFNNAAFSKADLDRDSYYVKSGYGQKTLKTINKESKKKFPEKSFGDLELDLSDRDIISYAYFLKQVEYLVAFEETDTARFNGEKVRGFYSDGEEQDENVEIIKYWSDDKFIISLKLKDDMDELILAKGFDMDDPEGIVYEINDLGDSQREILTEDEVFRMPNLHLDYHRDYEELLGKFLANQGFEDYAIAAMFENIKFDMDSKGARVENDATMLLEESMVAVNLEEPRSFRLDKPFWVVMKRADSRSPYFILGVNNTNLMESFSKKPSPKPFIQKSLEEEVVEEVTTKFKEDPVLYAKDRGYSINIEETGLPHPNSFSSYLWYEDTKILDEPLSGKSLGAEEFLIKSVHHEEAKDRVFLLGGMGCGGCVWFLDHYYLIDNSDLSVKIVDFEGPPGIDDFFDRGSPVATVFPEDSDDYANEFAYVRSFGDLYEPDDSYYEEIWVYLFDKNEWVLVEKLESGKTVQCIGMMIGPYNKRISYWKGGLNISPTDVGGDLYCE